MPKNLSGEFTAEATYNAGEFGTSSDNLTFTIEAPSTQPTQDQPANQKSPEEAPQPAEAM